MKISEARPSPPQSPSNSFRLRLQSELAERCASNPQYSLRSFALHLDVDHSTLFQLLRGKRELTEASIRKLGSALKLGADEVESYLADHRWWPAPDRGKPVARRPLRPTGYDGMGPSAALALLDRWRASTSSWRLAASPMALVTRP